MLRCACHPCLVDVARASSYFSWSFLTRIEFSPPRTKSLCVQSTVLNVTTRLWEKKAREGEITFSLFSRIESNSSCTRSRIFWFMILQMKKDHTHDGAPGVKGLTEVAFTLRQDSPYTRAEKRRRRKRRSKPFEHTSLSFSLFLKSDCRPFNLSQ